MPFTPTTYFSVLEVELHFANRKLTNHNEIGFVVEKKCIKKTLISGETKHQFHAVCMTFSKKAIRSVRVSFISVLINA